MLGRSPSLAHLRVWLAGLTQSPAGLGRGRSSTGLAAVSGTPRVPPTLPLAPSCVPRASGSALRGWPRFHFPASSPLSKSSTDIPQTREETWHSPLSRSRGFVTHAHRLCKCLLVGLFGSAEPELGPKLPLLPLVLYCLLPLPSPPNFRLNCVRLGLN